MSPSLSFDVPSCPKDKRLKGINVTFKYSVFGEDWAWFCKISTTKGVVDWMYNPKVFGKPEVGEVCTWLSYWPIGNTLNTEDTVNVSAVVISGLEVHECCVSLVYSSEETLQNNMGWIEILGGDLSGFKLNTRGYYLCRRDYFELMEVDRLTHDWFISLVGDTIDYTEIRGWRKTGRPKQVNDPSYTELKTIRCIIHGPQLEDVYNIAEMSKSTVDDKNAAMLKDQDYSSSSFMASSRAKAFSYDVFLNFRGADTGNTFTDHLYYRLIEEGIRTFKDDEDINRGKQLQPEIERAIRESRGSIVVLSENYARSTWCLDELFFILEQRRNYNHFVLPIFYHVEPSDVRKQRGSFAIQEPSSGWTSDNIKRWKEALREVAELKGLEVSGRETKLLKEIVDTIQTVMTTHAKEINS